MSVYNSISMPLSLLRLWLGPLPEEEIFPDKKPDPFLHWIIHPVKRRLAKYYLWFLQNFCGLTVIGITGSVGKTTTKNLLVSILKQSGPTVMTRDNDTPTYNLPTTILHTPVGTKYLVLEMGIEYIGDMDFYLWLAKPQIAILTPINLTHTQFFGDIKTITSEKNKITRFAEKTFSAADYKYSGYEINGILAAQVASYLHIPGTLIQSGLKTAPHPVHRLNFITLKSGATLIDDSYNANPLAVRQALQLLVQTAGEKHQTPVFVFAQMNELGAHEKSAHQEIGLLIKKLKIKHLFCLGPATKYTIKTAGFGKYFENQDDLFVELKEFVIGHLSFVILVKGSRTWHLENLVAKLQSL